MMNRHPVVTALLDGEMVSMTVLPLETLITEHIRGAIRALQSEADASNFPIARYHVIVEAVPVGEDPHIAPELFP